MKIERFTEEKIETIMVSDENFKLVIYAPPGKIKDEDVERIIGDYQRRKVTKGITKAGESDSMYLPRHSCMFIWSGVKTLIVKEKHFEGMLKKRLNLCDDNYKYGDIILTRMFEMSREEVDRSRKRSRLTDLDMEDWKGAQTFYGYDFEFEPLEEPQEVKVPHGAQTFFNIEKVEGDDWCSSQGGHWITVEGRHICIGDDKDLGNGLTERKLISPDHVTSLKFDVGRRQTVDEISSRYNSLSPELRSRINNIEITRGRETMAEHWARHGLDISESVYKKYSESEVGGYFNEKTKTITLLAGGGLEVYYHESGHAFEPSWDKGGKEWFKVWTTEKVSGYAAVDRHEGFAEATEAYFVDPKGLKVESPKTSKFMEEYYGGS